MTAILLNDLSRLARERTRVILNLGITVAMIVLALFVSSRPASLGSVALVAPAGGASVALPGYSVTVTPVAPRESELMSGKYDAIVSGSAETGYEVATLKSDAFRDRLLASLAGKSEPAAEVTGRPVGSTIAGFLLMFMLMQGTFTMYLFAEDKERGILPRIASSPVSIARYLAAHSAFAFVAILATNMAALLAVKAITGANTGFPLSSYLILFSVASALSTAIALCLNAFADKGDTANMAGSALVTLTSVLAGSFYSFERGNPTLEALIRVLPQKSWLESARLMDRGLPLGEAAVPLVWPIALSLALFAAAYAMTARKYAPSRGR